MGNPPQTLPQIITHAFHPEHVFLLYPNPAYPNGVFNCDACGNEGRGSVYHCEPCGIDLHTTCASLPLQYSHPCHHHQLSLAFHSPYPFSCRLCSGVRSAKTWSYRCSICGFHAHLSCVARTTVQQQTTTTTTYNNQQSYNAPTMMMMMQQQPNVMTGMTPYVSSSGGYPAMPCYYSQQPQLVGYEVQRSGYGYNNNNNGLGTQILDNSVNGLASGFGQAAGTVMFNDMFGGGGGGSSGGGGGGFFNF